MCNVNCNGITVSVGPTGPQGPQGIQGIAGTNGTNGVNGTSIIYMDTTNHTTTTTSSELLNTATIPANTFSSVGVCVYFDIIYNCSTTVGDQIAEIVIGDGSSEFILQIPFTGGVQRIRFTGKVIRTNSNTVAIYVSYSNFMYDGIQYNNSAVGTFDYPKQTVTSLNFANSMSIQALAESIAIGDVTEELMEVGYLNK